MKTIIRATLSAMRTPSHILSALVTLALVVSVLGVAGCTPPHH